MMTRHNSDAVLGSDIHFKAAVAFYPVCWLYNHVPGANFSDLVDGPIRIFVGTADDYDGGASACEALLHELAPAMPHMRHCAYSKVRHMNSTSSTARASSTTRAPTAARMA
jgi:dienelactone hydrolase